MTALRQNVLNMVTLVPEEELFDLYAYMAKMTKKKETHGDTTSADTSYSELLNMIKPIANLDEKRELEEYRMERYGI